MATTSTNDTLLAARVHDSVVQFLECTFRGTASATEHTDARTAVLCHLAEALRKLLVRVPVEVAWEETATLTAVLCSDLAHPATPSSDESAIRLHHLSQQDRHEQLYSPIIVSQFTLSDHGVNGLRIGWHDEASASDAALWVLGPTDTNGTLWHEFQMNIPALKLLFLSLAAPLTMLRLRDRKAQEARLRERANSLSSSRFTSLSRRLQRTIEWIRDASVRRRASPEVTRLEAEERDLFVSLLQQLLSTGWTDRLPSLRGKQDPARLLAELLGLHDEVSAVRPNKPPGVTDAGFEERCVVDALRSVLNRQPTGLIPGVDHEPAGKLRRQLLSILPFWTGLHEPLRDAAGDGEKGRRARERLSATGVTSAIVSVLSLDGNTECTIGSDDVEAALTSTSETLAKYLSRGWTASDTNGSDGIGTATFSEWLRTWFSLQILTILHGRGMDDLLPGERLAVCADLAFVLREVVRRALYKDRHDYSYQPSTFVAALRTLVEFHACVVGDMFREYELHTLLDDVGESPGPDRACSPTEHLQHILDIYITGHFILSLELVNAPSNEDAPVLTVADHLASPFHGAQASGHTLAQLRRAFSIAALAHDYGYLLYPSQVWSHTKLHRANRRLPDDLVAAPESSRATGESIVANCLEHLTLRGIIDPDQEVDLLTWIQRQAERGQPDHGLLSARFVEHLGSTVPEEERDVKRASTRAVLLHNAATVPIDANKDPVAALLLVCNELCEWDPLQRFGPPPSSIGRTLRTATTPSHVVEPRFVNLEIADLQFEERSPGMLRAYLPAGKWWPEFHATLQRSSRLDLPTFLVWLQMIQSVGRLNPIGPTMRVTSEVDAPLRKRRITWRHVIEWLAQHSSTSLRTGIGRWLAEARPFADSPGEIAATTMPKSDDDWPATETVVLRPLGFSICRDNVKRHFAELEREAEDFVFGADSTL